MDMIARLDPELVEPLRNIMEATGGGFSLTDVAATRAMVAGMVAAVKTNVPPVLGVTTDDRIVPSAEAGVDVPIRIYRPSDAHRKMPVLIWMHAGGFVIGSIELDDLMCADLAKSAGCVVVSVEYRLAPESRYPAPIDDCYGVLAWLSNNAGDLGIDASRIAVGGASAGGGLAAGLALRARDSGDYRLCMQLLIYPALDDRNTEQVSESIPENLFWSRENALIGWSAYLDGRQGTGSVPAYAAPIRAEDLAGLPATFIGVGSVDMFVAENLDYANRLIDAGVGTELHVYPGAFHAFDAFAPTSRLAVQFVADRNAALRRGFA